jgi:UDP-glucose 4-epimerase
MRVLVTGGAGFIGSHIVDRLVERGDSVLVVDDLSTGRRANLPPQASLVEMGVGDAELSNLMLDFRPDVVSHCAAQSSVAVSMSQPLQDAETNIIGGINVCRAAIDAGCDDLVYLNTGGVLYGDPDYLPCDEDHPARPVSGYALSKWTLEQYIKLLAPDTMRVKVLRLGNVYGPRQLPDGEAGVVAIFGGQMLRGEEVTIHGDGEQTKDYVYVGDVVEAHQLAVEARERLTVNIGTGEPTSVNTIFALLAEETGYTRPPVHGSPRPGDIRHIYLDTTRAQRTLGWAPRQPMREGLRRALAWLAEQG